MLVAKGKVPEGPCLSIHTLNGIHLCTGNSISWNSMTKSVYVASSRALSIPASNPRKAWPKDECENMATTDMSK